MPNQNQVTGNIPALRTYAKDLEDTRQAKNLTPRVVAVNEPETATKVAPQKLAPITTKPTKTTASKHTPEKEQIDVTKELSALNTKIIVDNEDAASATVITDTKRDRFKLFPALLSSINNWFSDQKKTRRQKAIPKYTIPQTTRRKGVIQKATSNTGKTATADFHQLQERIKQRSEKIEETEGKTIWTPDTEPGYLLVEEARATPEIDEAGEIIWTPDTEPGFLLLEEADTSPVTNVVIEPRKSYQSKWDDQEELNYGAIDENYSDWTEEGETAETTEPAASLAEEEDEGGTLKETNPWEAVDEIVETKKPDTDYEAVSPTQEDNSNMKETVSPNTSAPVTSDAPEENRPRTRLIPPRPNYTFDNSLWSQLKNLNTNALALVISAFILILLIGIFAAQIYLNRENTPTPSNSPEPQSLLLNTNLNLLVKNSNDGSNLISSLTSLRTSRQEITEAAFVEIFPSNDLVAPVEILNSLAVDLEKNLAQSISELRFGFSSEGQPFILMKVPDIIVAQGGLLLWEDEMYDNFSRIFALDPIPQSSNLNFSDSTFAGRDVRLIKQPSGSEILIYGLINNTVIITTTNGSYRELSILIK